MNKHKHKYRIDTKRHPFKLTCECGDTKYQYLDGRTAHVDEPDPKLKVFGDYLQKLEGLL